MVVRFGGLPDGVRRKAAVVPGMLSLTELRFWAREPSRASLRRAVRPFGAVSRRIASVLLPLTNRRLL